MDALPLSKKQEHCEALSVFLGLPLYLAGVTQIFGFVSRKPRTCAREPGVTEKRRGFSVWGCPICSTRGLIVRKIHALDMFKVCQRQ